MFAFIGGNDPPPYTPGLVYGFAGRALAWRIAFFVIRSDPARYRPLMIPSMVEKFSYSVAVTILVMQHPDAWGGPRFCLHRFATGSSICDRLGYDTAA
jgi:hypothetical protein